MRTKPNSALVETAIPARLDRLRWGRFHTLIVIALGITWILDGLEVTLAGAVAAQGKPNSQSHQCRGSGGRSTDLRLCARFINLA
jgi:hypothetical protein